ncbi:MAG: hypothetical protein GQ557_01565 [Mycoplasmataceae bacterium]|nr:hypothetical protein [Mycoplasmataceae bacterium]
MTRRNNCHLELIVWNKADILIANELKVDRVELVVNLEQGGLTPKRKVIKELTKLATIPVHVMLRLKNSDFYYNENEFNKLLKELNYIKKTKATGIVFGSLTLDDKINEDQLKQIIKHKGNLELTYHRAVDVTSKYLQSIKTLSEYLEINYVLTSGAYNLALDGLDNLIKASDIINNKIIVGSGLSLQNLDHFNNLKNIYGFHFGSSIRIEQELDKDLNKSEIKLIKEKLTN